MVIAARDGWADIPANDRHYHQLAMDCWHGHVHSAAATTTQYDLWTSLSRAEFVEFLT